MILAQQGLSKAFYDQPVVCFSPGFPTPRSACPTGKTLFLGTTNSFSNLVFAMLFEQIAHIDKGLQTALACILIYTAVCARTAADAIDRGWLFDCGSKPGQTCHMIFGQSAAFEPTGLELRLMPVEMKPIRSKPGPHHQTKHTGHSCSSSRTFRPCGPPAPCCA